MRFALTIGIWGGIYLSTFASVILGGKAAEFVFKEFIYLDPGSTPEVASKPEVFKVVQPTISVESAGQELLNFCFHHWVEITVAFSCWVFFLLIAMHGIWYYFLVLPSTRRGSSVCTSSSLIPK